MTLIPSFVRIGQVVQKFESRGGEWGWEQTLETYFFRLRKETWNYIKHSSCWEANSCPATQQIPHFMGPPRLEG